MAEKLNWFKLLKRNGKRPNVNKEGFMEETKGTKGVSALRAIAESGIPKGARWEHLWHSLTTPDGGVLDTSKKS